MYHYQKKNKSLSRRNSVQLQPLEEQKQQQSLVEQKDLQVVISLYQINKQLIQEDTVKYIICQHHLNREVISVLSLIPYFIKTCPPNVQINEFLLTAIPGFEYEFFAAGQAVFHNLDKGDKFYIILKGVAGVYVPIPSEMLMSYQTQVDLARKIRNPILRTDTDMDAKLYCKFWKKKSPQQLLDDVALLTAGRIEIYFTKEMICQYQKVHQIGQFQSFGEIALTTDKPRTASIIALEDLHLLSLTKQEYRRISDQQIQSLYQRIDFFSDLFHSSSKNTIGKVVQYFKEISINPKQIIWQEGEEAKYCLVIKSGKVQLTKSNINHVPNLQYMVNTQQQFIYCFVCEGNFVGEDDILQMRPRRFTCQTLNEAVKVYYITLEDILHLKKMFPEVIQSLQERSNFKNRWFDGRELNIIDTNNRQSKVFLDIGKPKPKPPERITIMDIRKSLHIIDKSDEKKSLVRSVKGLALPSKTELLEHKIKLHLKHSKRTERFIGTDSGAFKIEDSNNFQKSKQQVENRFYQFRQDDRTDQQIETKRSLSEHLVLPIAIKKSFTKSLLRSQRWNGFTSLSGQRNAGGFSLSVKNSDIEKKSLGLQQHSDRLRNQSVSQQQSMFMTELFNCFNLPSSRSPIHQSERAGDSSLRKGSQSDLKKNLRFVQRKLDYSIENKQFEQHIKII